MVSHVNLKFAICVLLILILQVFLTPIIQINGITPNLILSFTISLAVVVPNKPLMWISCVAALLYDLISGGTIGTMAISIAISILILTTIIRHFEIEKTWLLLLLMCVAIIFAEFVYGGFQSAFSINYSVLEIFLLKVLPCSIYDIIIALIMLVINVRLFPDDPYFIEESEVESNGRRT